MVPGLGWGGFFDMKWKEEVAFQDGRIVIVEREMLTEAGGGEWAHNRSGRKPKEYRLRFNFSDSTSGVIVWASKKNSPGGWPEVPLVLDFESGNPIIFSLVAISIGCEAYSKYIYQEGRWIESPLPESFQQRPPNLLFGNKKDMPSLVTLDEKFRRNNSTVYRRSLRQIGPGRQVCG